MEKAAVGPRATEREDTGVAQLTGAQELLGLSELPGPQAEAETHQSAALAAIGVQADQGQDQADEQINNVSLALSTAAGGDTLLDHISDEEDDSDFHPTLEHGEGELSEASGSSQDSEGSASVGQENPGNTSLAITVKPISSKVIDVLSTLELVSEIIEYVATTGGRLETLCGCALVSRAWARASIGPLYRSIHLVSNSAHFKKFMRSLYTTTKFRHHVRALHIKEAVELASIEALLYSLPDLQVLELENSPRSTACDERVFELPSHSNLRMIKLDCSPSGCACCEGDNEQCPNEFKLAVSNRKGPPIWPKARVLHLQAVNQPLDEVANWLAVNRAPSMEMLCFNTRLDWHNDPETDGEEVQNLVQFVSTITSLSEAPLPGGRLELLELSLASRTSACKRLMGHIKKIDRKRMAVVVNWREGGKRYTYLCPPTKEHWELCSPFNLLWNWGPISKRLRQANWSYWKIMLLGHHDSTCVLSDEFWQDSFDRYMMCSCEGEEGKHLDTEGIVSQAEIKSAFGQGKKMGAQAIRANFKSMEQWQGWRN